MLMLFIAVLSAVPPAGADVHRADIRLPQRGRNPFAMKTTIVTVSEESRSEEDVTRVGASRPSESATEGRSKPPEGVRASGAAAGERAESEEGKPASGAAATDGVTVFFIPLKTRGRAIRPPVAHGHKPRPTLGRCEGGPRRQGRESAEDYDAGPIRPGGRYTLGSGMANLVEEQEVATTTPCRDMPAPIPGDPKTG
jgi:hypothetical protein